MSADEEGAHKFIEEMITDDGFHAEEILMWKQRDYFGNECQQAHTSIHSKGLICTYFNLINLTCSGCKSTTTCMSNTACISMSTEGSYVSLSVITIT